MEQLKTEPCAWRLVQWKNGIPEILGVIMAHVDDFIIVGDEIFQDWLNVGGDGLQSLWGRHT